MKKAFTMIELVFVIVVIGILAAVMIPRTSSDRLREAAIQLVSHIRYTQHLAMVDDRYGDNVDSMWYKKRWQIRFCSGASADGKWAYTIFSDNDGAGHPSALEVAKDPSNNESLLSGGCAGSTSLDINGANFKGIKKLNLGLSYSVIDIDFGGCNQRFAFDHIGRPINSSLDSYTKSYETNDIMQTRCNITLKGSDGNVTIAIEPETGYAHIL